MSSKSVTERNVGEYSFLAYYASLEDDIGLSLLRLYEKYKEYKKDGVLTSRELFDLLLSFAKEVKEVVGKSRQLSPEEKKNLVLKVVSKLAEKLVESLPIPFVPNFLKNLLLKKLLSRLLNELVESVLDKVFDK